MRALAIAATGMSAQQLNVEVIANNIANINTTGFKRARAEFTDLLYQTDRAAGTLARDDETMIPEGNQLGLGVRTVAIRHLSMQGALSPTSNKLDLALDSYQCGIWEAVLGKAGSIWDERMHELYGLRQSNAFVTEETWLSRIHPDDRGLALESARHFKQVGDTHTLVCRVPDENGGVRYVRSVGKVHRTPTGEMKIIGIAFDSTEDALMTLRLKAAYPKLSVTPVAGMV